MDFQLTDGKAMILRHVTSYVSKWKDAYSNRALYSTNLGPYQAAYRHLKEMEPCELEMWLSMTSIKMSWPNSRTKEYIVPNADRVQHNKIHAKYLARPDTMESNTFVEWLRLVTHTANHPKPYKGSTLVSVKMCSRYCNIFLLTSKESKLLCGDGLATYAKKLQPLIENLKSLNTKNRETPATQAHVKCMLKRLLKGTVGADEQTNALIDEAIEVGAALFLTATHLLVARTLLKSEAVFLCHRCNHRMGKGN